MTLLELEGIWKRFPGVLALDDVSLCFEMGTIHALVGENGAGKSTLNKIIGGALLPDQGTLTLAGSRLELGDPLLAERNGIRVIYQELTLVPELTVTENMFLGREEGRWLLRRAAMQRRAQEVLHELGAEFSPGTRVASLTIAQQQLVEIARALVTESKVIVLDEPTSSLPEPEVARLFRILRGLRDRGLAILYVSHRLDEIFDLTDYVSVLRDGRVVGSARTCDLDRRTLIRMMVGRDLEEEFPARSSGPLSALLEVEGLSHPPRMHDVCLRVDAGEIVGLAGLVGSGRTSTALALFGAIPSQGSIRLRGTEIRPRHPHEAIQLGIGYVTEDRKKSGLFPALSTQINMTIAALEQVSRGGMLSPARERALAQQAVEDFDVRAAGLWQPAGTLSGGNQQKLLLARYLIEHPGVLILDEPTRGIDVGAKSEIYRLMNQLTERGVGILMISSELPEILGMSDRVVVMREGRTVGELSRSEATQETIMQLATGGEAAA